MCICFTDRRDWSTMRMYIPYGWSMALGVPIHNGAGPAIYVALRYKARRAAGVRCTMECYPLHSVNYNGRKCSGNVRAQLCRYYCVDWRYRCFLTYRKLSPTFCYPRKNLDRALELNGTVGGGIDGKPGNRENDVKSNCAGGMIF